VSFQISVLKVLAGHPGGRASVADLRHAGTDWTDRTKRLAARAPGLDIFSQSFVLRDDAGWQITDAGRAFLASVETPIQSTADNEQPPEAVATSVPSPALPPIRLVAVNRRSRRRRVRNRMRPSAVAEFLAVCTTANVVCRIASRGSADVATGTVKWFNPAKFNPTKAARMFSCTSQPSKKRD
jgi:hypothetical protein